MNIITPNEDDYLAVKRGIQWLDENSEPDWRQMIDLKTLRLINCHQCILGQLFGDYHEVRMVGEPHWAAEHGFCTYTNDADDYRWERLTAAWVEVLSEH